MNNLLQIFKSFFSAPVFEGDEEKSRTAKLLHQMVVTVWIMLVLAVIVAVLDTSIRIFATQAIVFIAVSLVLVMGLNRAGRLTLASQVIVGIMLLAFTYINFVSAGEQRPLLLLTVISILIGGLLLGPRGAMTAAVTLMAQNTIITVLAMKGLIVPQDKPATQSEYILVNGVAYLAIGFLFRLAIQRIQFAVSQLQASNRELQGLSTTLEQRVAERSQALAQVAEISTLASNIPDELEMLAAVVHLVQRRFGLYHAHVFTYHEENQVLQIEACGYREGDEHEGTHGTTAIPLDQEQSLVARAARTKKPVIVNDVRSDAGWLPNPLLPDTAAELAVPLLVADKLVGVLDVQSERANFFTDSDADIQMTLGAQIAVALQNIRQFGTTRKIASDMSVVATVGLATSTITEADRLLQEVVDLSKKSFHLYHAHIYLMNEAEDTLELAAGAGEVGRQMVAEKRRIPLDSEQSLVARAARTREGVVVNDVTIAPDFLPNPLLPDTRSEMAVPMISQGKVIGVLDVQSEVANRFTDLDINIKTTLASQIAVAVQNARNLSQSKRQAEREAAINLITQRIQSATTVEAALQIAAREIGHALGMKPTLITIQAEANSEATRKTGTGVS